VDAEGRVTAATQSTGVLDILAAELDVFLQGPVSIGYRAELLPPTNRRARLEATNELSLRMTARVRLQTYGATH
jgi:hypothetical protein